MTVNYLTPTLGKQVSLVLRNETVHGRVTSVDLTMGVITLAVSMDGETFTIHAKTSKIQAILIQDVP